MFVCTVRREQRRSSDPRGLREELWRQRGVTLSTHKTPDTITDCTCEGRTVGRHCRSLLADIISRTTNCDPSCPLGRWSWTRPQRWTLSVLMFSRRWVICCWQRGTTRHDLNQHVNNHGASERTNNSSSKSLNHGREFNTFNVDAINLQSLNSSGLINWLCPFTEIPHPYNQISRTNVTFSSNSLFLSRRSAVL